MKKPRSRTPIATKAQGPRPIATQALTEIVGGIVSPRDPATGSTGKP